MIVALWLACADPQALPAANPLLAIDRGADRAPFRAVVDERVDAGGYVYLRFGDRWVAAIDHGLQVGDDAEVAPIGLARDFTSHRTGRRFDALWFGVARP